MNGKARALLLRARIRSRKKSRGTALIMVLGAITVLTVFLTQLQEETSAEVSSALTEADSIRGEYYARSAVNLSRLLIATEPSIRKLVSPIYMMMGRKKAPQLPVWKFTDLVLKDFNGVPPVPTQSEPEGEGGGKGAPGTSKGSEQAPSQAAATDPLLGKNLGLGDRGYFNLVIVDEDSKINMNLANKGDAFTLRQLGAQILSLIGPQQYNPMFEGEDLDKQYSDRTAICSALVDWADPDEDLYACDPFNTGPVATGTEDNYYQTVGLNYFRKNAAYDSLDELRLVRGMSDDFWSTFVDPEPSNPEKRVVTVWGQAAVNVNTANAMTLLAIVCANAAESELCTDPLQAEAFLAGVSMAKALTQGAPLFSSKNDFIATMQGKGMLGPVLAALNVKPVTFKVPKDVKNAVSTESKIFSIYAEGIVPGYRRETRTRIHAVVDFRGAEPLGADYNPMGGSTQNAAAGPGFGGPSRRTSSSSGSTDALTKSWNTNPAGTVIYWRVE